MGGVPGLSTVIRCSVAGDHDANGKAPVGFWPWP